MNYFDPLVVLKKEETNSNWLRRPLSENQINYALDDVDYLLEILRFFVDC